MSYREFIETVAARGWTIRQLRSDDAPPSAELLEFIDQADESYERFVSRAQAELYGNCPKCNCEHSRARRRNANKPDDHKGDRVCFGCGAAFWGKPCAC